MARQLLEQDLGDPMDGDGGVLRIRPTLAAAAEPPPETRR